MATALMVMAISGVGVSAAIAHPVQSSSSDTIVAVVAGTVVVPAPLLADPPPFFGEDIIVGVVMDPVTDVHSVVAFRFRMPG